MSKGDGGGGRGGGGGRSGGGGRGDAGGDGLSVGEDRPSSGVSGTAKLTLVCFAFAVGFTLLAIDLSSRVDSSIANPATPVVFTSGATATPLVWHCPAAVITDPVSRTAIINGCENDEPLRVLRAINSDFTNFLIDARNGYHMAREIWIDNGINYNVLTVVLDNTSRITLADVDVEQQRVLRIDIYQSGELVSSVFSPFSDTTQRRTLTVNSARANVNGGYAYNGEKFSTELVSTTYGIATRTPSPTLTPSDTPLTITPTVVLSGTPGTVVYVASTPSATVTATVAER